MLSPTPWLATVHATRTPSPVPCGAPEPLDQVCRQAATGQAVLSPCLSTAAAWQPAVSLFLCPHRGRPIRPYRILLFHPGMVIYRIVPMADKLMFITNDDTQNYPFIMLQPRASKLFYLGGGGVITPYLPPFDVLGYSH